MMDEHEIAIVKAMSNVVDKQGKECAQLKREIGRLRVWLKHIERTGDLAGVQKALSTDGWPPSKKKKA